jgi:hypothetical protein
MNKKPVKKYLIPGLIWSDIKSQEAASMEQFLVGSRWPKVIVHIRFPEHTDQRYINFTMWAISKIIKFVYWTIKANKIRS